jgi:hypothetical protein
MEIRWSQIYPRIDASCRPDEPARADGERTTTCDVTATAEVRFGAIRSPKIHRWNRKIVIEPRADMQRASYYSVGSEKEKEGRKRQRIIGRKQ